MLICLELILEYALICINCLRPISLTLPPHFLFPSSVLGLRLSYVIFIFLSLLLRISESQPLTSSHLLRLGLRVADTSFTSSPSPSLSLSLFLNPPRSSSPVAFSRGRCAPLSSPFRTDRREATATEASVGFSTHRRGVCVCVGGGGLRGTRRKDNRLRVIAAARPRSRLRRVHLLLPGAGGSDSATQIELQLGALQLGANRDPTTRLVQRASAWRQP